MVSSLLSILFFLTALIYAMVGFGGGSTYTALLILQGTSYLLVPAIALICNLLVVTGGVWRFKKAKLIAWERIAPLLFFSIPAAFIGARLNVSEAVFVGLLGIALLCAGGQLLLPPKKAQNTSHVSSVLRHDLKLVSFGFGAAIGLLSGIVGIGGGIFLAPVLYAMRWGGPREIAGACSCFIFANSLAGLLGQIIKLNKGIMPRGVNIPPESFGVFDLLTFWPLFLMVIIGGQFGSLLGSRRLDPLIIKRLTAGLILYVAIRLLRRWAYLMGWIG